MWSRAPDSFEVAKVTIYTYALLYRSLIMTQPTEVEPVEMTACPHDQVSKCFVLLKLHCNF